MLFSFSLYVESANMFRKNQRRQLEFLTPMLLPWHLSNALISARFRNQCDLHNPANNPTVSYNYQLNFYSGIERSISWNEPLMFFSFSFSFLKKNRFLRCSFFTSKLIRNIPGNRKEAGCELRLPLTRCVLLSLQTNRYEQCVTFDSFPTKAHEISYAAFGMLMMYVLPLAVFIFTYSSILCEISRRSKEGNFSL